MFLPYIASFIASLIAFIGILVLVLRKSQLDSITTYLVALSAGAFLGNTFFHLLPEAVELAEEVAIDHHLILQIPILGILSLFLLEKFLHWHYDRSRGDLKDHAIHPVALNNLIGDGFHNFLDGIAIAAGFLISTEVGIATTIAIVLHELPQEISDFAVLVKFGMSRGRALFWNFVSALVSLLGVLFFQYFSDTFENIEPYALAFISGVFIYIAATDLLPVLHNEKGGIKSNFFRILFLFVGVALMLLLSEASH